MRWFAALIAGVIITLGISSAGAQAAEKQCGIVSAVFYGDLTSGGFVTIDGRKFLVGGVGPRNVVLPLPPARELGVGVRACAVGEFRVLADGTVDLYNGEVFVEPAARTLPNTSTAAADARGAVVLGLLSVLGLGLAPVAARRLV